MKSKLKKDVLVNVGWLFGLLLMLVISIGASAMRLSGQKSRLIQLRSELAEKEKSLRYTPKDAAALVELAELQAQRSESQGMVASESRRVEALSEAAGDAGVTLVAIKCLQEEYSEDSRVVSVSHELGALGNYRELGRFLSGLQSSEGTIGIEAYEIRRDEDAESDELRASLTVTWYAALGQGAKAVATAQENG